MRITERAFAASLDCKTKCLLYLRNEPSSHHSEFVLWSASIQAQFEISAANRVCATLPAGRVFLGTPPLPDLRTRSNPYVLILGYEVATAEVQSQLHALTLTTGRGAGHQEYSPVRFIHRNKLNNSDRLRLAFDALAVSQDLGYVPATGKLIHGNNYRAVTVKLAPWVKKVRRLMATIPHTILSSAPPPPTLNKHCGECEFQNRCRQNALQQDDLSLLANLTE